MDDTRACVPNRGTDVVTLAFDRPLQSFSRLFSLYYSRRIQTTLLSQLPSNCDRVFRQFVFDKPPTVACGNITMLKKTQDFFTSRVGGSYT